MHESPLFMSSLSRRQLARRRPRRFASSSPARLAVAVACAVAVALVLVHGGL